MFQEQNKGLHRKFIIFYLVIVPAGFDPNLPIRIVAPGFIMSSKGKNFRDLVGLVAYWVSFTVAFERLLYARFCE